MMARGLFRYGMAATAVAGAGLLAVTAAPSRERDAPVQPVVVELFTSQGCSSCPPADKILGELSSDPSIIALSMPIDYWDYLGWKDTLADSRFSARQRAYSRMRGDREVYTPQVVVNGSAVTGGWDDHSDLDVEAWCTGPATPTYDAVLGVLRSELEVDHVWELPDATWPTGRQCFVHLQPDAADLTRPTRLLDLVVLYHTGDVADFSGSD